MKPGKGHRVRQFLATTLQAAYEKNRAPETWGTPSVSGAFFDTWRISGFPSAMRFLVKKEATVGKPDADPRLKTAVLVVGSLLLILGVRKLRELAQDSNTSSRGENQNKKKYRAATALYFMTIGMLMFACEGEAERQRKEEQKQKEKENIENNRLAQEDKELYKQAEEYYREAGLEGILRAFIYTYSVKEDINATKLTRVTDSYLRTSSGTYLTTLEYIDKNGCLPRTEREVEMALIWDFQRESWTDSFNRQIEVSSYKQIRVITDHTGTVRVISAIEQAVALEDWRKDRRLLSKAIEDAYQRPEQCHFRDET